MRGQSQPIRFFCLVDGIEKVLSKSWSKNLNLELLKLVLDGP